MARKPQVSGESRPLDRLSLREYAARRRSLGLSCSLSTVQAAIKSGRIHRTCPEHQQCPPSCGRGKIDPSTADAEWAAWTDTTRRPPSAERLELRTLAEAKHEKEVWLARLAQQKHDREAGILVPAADAMARVFRNARVVRDLLLSLPRRLAGTFAVETDPVVIERAMEAEIRQVLSGLDKDFRP